MCAPLNGVEPSHAAEPDHRVRKSILFLSIMDFTEKGIQVVRLTPAYFARRGWTVHYVVARDCAKTGSYHYQNAVNPDNICVHRTEMPSARIFEQLANHTLATIYSKIRGYVSIAKMAWIGYRVIRNNRIDAIYGGGPHGVLAANILNAVCARRRFVTVARFYGVWDLYTTAILERRWVELALNFDVLVALYLRTSLKIITNDGTQGNKALGWIRPRSLETLRYYVNGVDKPTIDPEDVRQLKTALRTEGTFVVCCITRLVSTKRIDRCIRVAASAVHKQGMGELRLIVVGDGPERLRFEKLARDLDVTNNVVFAGAVDNRQVRNYLAIADVFLSMYDVSNVGNPLLEAIRANKIIFTLDNGDTSSWIRHGLNGFIYQVHDSMIDRIARDLASLAHNLPLQDTIKRNIKATELEKLWTWDERLSAEYSEVNKLVEESP